MKADPTSLDRLHDVLAPPPTPWWPPAPGWYVVLGALALAVAALLLWALRHWLRNRYRHEALAELARQEAALADPAQRLALVAQLSELLKRTALSAWPREEVASLTGPAWLAFLDRTAHISSFSSGPGRDLETAVYDSRIAASLNDTQIRELTTLVRHWLTHHHVERSPASPFV